MTLANLVHHLDTISGDTHPAWNPAIANPCPLRRRHPRVPDGGRRILAQPLLDARIQILQTLQPLDRDIIIPRNRLPHLPLQSIHLLRTRRQVERQPGQQRRRRLRPRPHKHFRVRMHLGHRHRPVPARHLLPQVRLVRAVREARLDAHGGVVPHLLALRGHARARQKQQHDAVDGGVAAQHVEDGHAARLRRHGVHPVLVLRAAVEQAQRRREGQVGHDVEGGHAVPAHQVDGACGRGEPREQLADVRLQQRLLALERAVREAVRERLALAGVRGAVVAAQDIRRPVGRRLEQGRVLGEGGLSGFVVPVDVFHGAGVDVAELVRADAHDRAVF